ncbi:MAG: ankyrin repeat protein [Phycisphaerales bacterium]|nr:ankyrin repeat protein [Phycisphaerales bacterium]
MSKSLPERALPDRVDLEWYRKAAKKQLKLLRADKPAAQLADAQRAVARRHGFTSWRKLKDRVDAATFQRAFDEDDGETLAKVLAANPALAKATNFTWTHPSGERRSLPPMAIAACLRQNADMVRALIAAGVNVNAPAVYAANRPDLTRLLLDAGMSPNAITFPENCTGLMYAAFIDDLDNARLLLDRKADPRIALPNCGSTAMHWLNWRPEKKRMADTIELAKLLTAAGANVNACTFTGLNDQPITDDGNLYLVEHGGATALHWAAAHGTEPLVRTLLSLGADRTLRTVSRLTAKKHPTNEKRWAFDRADGLTPADLAKQNGHDAVARLLGGSKAVTVAAAVDPLPLTEAIRAGDAALAARLIKATPTLAQARNADGASILHLAVEFDRAAIVKTLIDAGADLHAVYGRSVHTPLSWSIVVGAFDSAAVLLKAGVKPDLYCAAGLNEVEALAGWFDADGYALPGASTTGSTRYLADGAKLPSPPTDPVELASDALVLACRNGRASAVKFLLTKKVDLSFRVYMGGTALHWANCNGDRKVIAMLIAAGADQTARDDVMQATPRAFGICVPANWGHIDWLKRAIARDKSLVNCFDARGTPLHEAARNGQASAVRTLLKAGADAAVRDADGKTPQDLARDKGHAAVAELLNVPAPVATPPATQRLGFIALPVADLTRTRHFYANLLEAEVLGEDTNAIDFGFAGVRLRAYVHVGEYRRQHSGLQFLIDGLDARVARLKASGVGFRGEIRNEPWGGRVITVADPDGNLFDFVDADYGKTLGGGNAEAPMANSIEAGKAKKNLVGRCPAAPSQIPQDPPMEAAHGRGLHRRRGRHRNSAGRRRRSECPQLHAAQASAITSGDRAEEIGPARRGPFGRRQAPAGTRRRSAAARHARRPHRAAARGDRFAGVHYVAAGSFRTAEFLSRRGDAGREAGGRPVKARAGAGDDSR